MADMPDLDTTQVSWVAWWNLMDHADPTPDSINPEDTLSAYSFDSTEYYDNGIIAEYNPVAGQSVYIRVKSDGWFVAYMDRSEYYSNQTADISQFTGEFMLCGLTWDSYGISNNILATSINDMASELGVWSDVSWLFSDVGLYNYKSEGSNAIYFNSRDNGDMEWYYTNTTPKCLFVFGEIYCDDSNDNRTGSYSDEVTGLSNSISGNVGAHEYGVDDVLDYNPQEGTIYAVSVTVDPGYSAIQTGLTYLGVY